MLNELLSLQGLNLTSVEQFRRCSDRDDVARAAAVHRFLIAQARLQRLCLLFKQRDGSSKHAEVDSDDDEE